MRAEDDVPLAALKTKPAAAKKRKAPTKDSKKKKKKKTSSSAKVRAPPAAARRPVCSRGPSLSAGRAATQGKGKAKAKPAKKKGRGKGRKQPKNAWRVRGGRRVYFDATGKQLTGAAAMVAYRRANGGGS